MSTTERDNSLLRRVDSDEDRMSDKSATNKSQSNCKTAASLYDTRDHVTYRKRTDISHLHGSERPRSNCDVQQTAATTNSLYRTSVLAGDSTSSTIIHTKSVAETERYLDTHGIDLCKNANVIQRTLTDQEAEYEQRVCIRYLKPPPLPPPGPLTIEERRRPTSLAPPLIIREQEVAVDSPPPLILRERPPKPPPIPLPETKTVIIPSGTSSQRSVIIERYPSLPEKPRDIVIERWLPYGPLPEREVIRRSVVCDAEAPKPTCTIINYDNIHAHVNRSFVVVDIYNADPEDYTARYRESLLDSRELCQEARRAGVTEDITSQSSLSVGRHVETRRADYRKSRDTLCDCLLSDFAANSKEFKGGARSSYIVDSTLAGVNNTARHEQQSNYRTVTKTCYSRGEEPY